MTKSIILENYIYKRHYKEIKSPENLNLMSVIISFDKFISSNDTFLKLFFLQISKNLYIIVENEKVARGRNRL